MHDGEADEFVHFIATDWRLAGLAPEDEALCLYAQKLTHEPAAMIREDVILLRETGWNDSAIHDASQVIAYFNYINRIADALGVDLESGIHAWEKSPPTTRQTDV